MAEFIGTIKEFTKFIGAYARIKVMHISAKHKKTMAKCETCGNSEHLHSAHLKGQERPIIIANILSQFIENDVVRIDLNEFEERFVNAHLPIESVIRILCRTCHRDYDRVEKKEKDVSKKDSFEKEGELIQQLIKNQMNKSKALQLTYSKGLTKLNNSNTIFSNIITNLDAWWLQPYNDKFMSLLHIILNDNRVNKLFVFKLPAGTINDPSKYFKQRNDSYKTNCSDIIIPTTGKKFLTKISDFDLTPYLIETIEY